MTDVRKNIFWKHYEDKKRIVELCLLPPCQMNLRYQSQRVNYEIQMVLSPFEYPFGWNDDMSMYEVGKCKKKV